MFLPDLVIPHARGPRRPHCPPRCSSRGKIIGVLDFDDVPSGCPIDEAEGAVVMPGVVDSHVHVNEPGRTEWEGFETATRAAAAGGVTTIVDMPLNSIPATTTPMALQAKRRAAEGKCHVDVGFWGGVVPGNAQELAPLFAEGVFGFKCFLVDSGVPEFPRQRNQTCALRWPRLPGLVRRFSCTRSFRVRLKLRLHGDERTSAGSRRSPA